jgi:hypothetical protein
MKTGRAATAMSPLTGLELAELLLASVRRPPSAAVGPTSSPGLTRARMHPKNRLLGAGFRTKTAPMSAVELAVTKVKNTSAQEARELLK